jgi:Predicted periplasmic or secreted lipoprotein
MMSHGERAGLIAVGGLGVGAALMFFFDPEMGHRRRARVRLAVARVAGGARSDEAIGARVRAVLARSVSYPRSITVTVANGHVVLGGPVIAREVEQLLRRVRRVGGVRSVRSRMDAHDWAADVPGLQGVAKRPRRMGGWELLERRWSTGAKLVGSAALGALALRGAHALR